jgi:nicotinamidase-related amidase
MRTRLTPPTTALLIVDIQERLAAAMPAEILAQVTRNVEVLVDAAARFAIPIYVSEQYPKGLGPTTAPVAAALAAAEGKTAVHRWEKIEFSAVASAGFTALPAPEPGPDAVTQWLVAGMETHVCIYQTVRDLAGQGATVHLVGDAVASRTKANYRVGIGLARDAGAVITSTEVVVFDLLERAGGDNFKALSKAIR